MDTKQKLLNHYGNGNNAEAARQLGISPQRLSAYPDELTRLQKDGLIGMLYRLKKTIPGWLIK